VENSNPKSDQGSDTTPTPTSGTDLSLDTLASRLAAKRVELNLPDPVAKPIAAVVAKAMAKTALTEQELREREEAKQEMARRQHERERLANWEKFAALRGKRYAECRLGNYEATTDRQRQSVELLTDYCENLADRVDAGINVVLAGPAGTGKDHLMTAICRAAILAGRNVMWRNGQDLWGDFRDAISSEANESQTINRFARADILAVSDPLPPRGPMSDFQVATFFRIIDARYSAMRPTFVTLNIASRQEADERMGLQIMDRLCHGALVVGCNWTSYRVSK
jgi:DNA replication protein DnaC